MDEKTEKKPDPAAVLGSKRMQCLQRLGVLHTEMRRMAKEIEALEQDVDAIDKVLSVL